MAKLDIGGRLVRVGILLGSFVTHATPAGRDALPPVCGARLYSAHENFVLGPAWLRYRRANPASTAATWQKATREFSCRKTDKISSGLRKKTGVKITPEWEASMREYEIRIFSQNHAQTVIEVMQLNDHGAIRAAKKMADGKLFEVWRDLDCIYSPAGERTHAHRLRPTA